MGPGGSDTSASIAGAGGVTVSSSHGPTGSALHGRSTIWGSEGNPPHNGKNHVSAGTLTLRLQNAGVRIRPVFNSQQAKGVVVECCESVAARRSIAVMMRRTVVLLQLWKIPRKVALTQTIPCTIRSGATERRVQMELRV